MTLHWQCAQVLAADDVQKKENTAEKGTSKYHPDAGRVQAILRRNLLRPLTGNSHIALIHDFLLPDKTDSHPCKSHRMKADPAMC